MVLCVIIRCTTLVSTNFNFLFATCRIRQHQRLDWELGSCGFLFQWKWSQLWMIWVIAMWLLCYLVCYMFPIDIQIPGEEVCMKGVLIAYPEHAVDTTHRNPKTLEPPKWRRWKRRSPRNPRRDFITFCQVGKIVWSEEICEHPRKGHVSYYVYIYRNAAYFG